MDHRPKHCSCLQSPFLSLPGRHSPCIAAYHRPAQCVLPFAPSLCLTTRAHQTQLHPGGHPTHRTNPPPQALERYCNWLENRVVQRFDAAVAEADARGVSECVRIMAQFDRESTIAQVRTEVVADMASTRQQT